MPEAVAQAIETPSVVAEAQPAFLVEIGDVADLRQRQASLQCLSRGPTNLELAEIASKIAQPFVIEMLVMEYQHGVAVDRLPDSADHRGISGFIEFDAANFGSELRMNRPNFDRHACNLQCSAALASTLKICRGAAQVNRSEPTRIQPRSQEPSRCPDRGAPTSGKIAEEDAKRPNRERECLLRERTRP